MSIKKPRSTKKEHAAFDNNTSKFLNKRVASLEN